MDCSDFFDMEWEMGKIDFSYNWNNKLNCKVFTTFRLQNQKYREGERLEVYLKKEYLGVAEVVSCATLTLNQVTEGVALIDTGYPLDEFKKIIRRMYKTADREYFNLMFLKWIEKPEVKK
jgi:uncharacterized protein YqfB (UPF0267 family)